MSLAKDLSDLPRGSGSGGAGTWAPDPEPRFGRILVDAWHAEAHDVPLAREDARFRHSDAGACSRMLAYKALGIPRSNPVDSSGSFIMRFGTYAHEEWQRHLTDRYGGKAQVELKVGEGERAGHIDAVVRLQPEEPIVVPGGPDTPHAKIIAIEAKTVGGFRYKQAMGIPPAARAPQGPSYSHVIQAALNAKDANADEAVVIYWTREAVSMNLAKGRNLGDYGRVVAEWTMEREVYEPIADKEIERIERILGLVDSGTLPARKIPDPELPTRHIITSPRTGEWVSTNPEGIVEDAGVSWHCGYCGWQTICEQTPASRTEIAQVPVVVDLLEEKDA